MKLRSNSKAGMRAREAFERYCKMNHKAKHAHALEVKGLYRRAHRCYIDLMSKELNEYFRESLAEKARQCDEKARISKPSESVAWSGFFGAGGQASKTFIDRREACSYDF